MKRLKRLVYSLFLIIVFLYSASATKAQIVFEDWSPTAPVWYNVAGTYSFVSNNNIYVLGGSASGGFRLGIRAQPESTGNIPFWSFLSAIPSTRYWHAGAHTDSFVYLIGGANDYWAPLSTVSRGRILSNGDISEWQDVRPLPKTLVLPGAVVNRNKLFVAGGNVINSDHTGTSTNDLVYFAEINQMDGSLGDWNVSGTLPYKLMGFGMMEINNYLYIFGGRTLNDSDLSLVKRAVIYEDGTIGAWEDQPPLPEPFWRVAITRSGDVLVTAGGEYGAYPSNDSLKSVYYSRIGLGGSISSWQAGKELPRVNCCSPIIAWNDNLYLIGGHDGASYFNTVYRNRILTTTPSPTKVVFAPGFGGSWNAEAILNCSPDSNPDGWTLAPYAEQVYLPLISALNASGWDVNEFYYDWRRAIPETGQALSEFIQNQTESNEKVNYVGHSMGGLVGREYIQSSSDPKIANYLSAGSPHKGVPFAYPAWSGGDVWQDNFLAKIASTLYLKHCGGIASNDRETVQSNFPSVQNLLPINDYLRDFRTGILKPVLGMVAQNNWIGGNFSPPLGIRTGSLSGTGYDTLNSIPVKNRNRHDERLNNWEDGRPAGKETTSLGDGTVTEESSKLESADWVQSINQTHSGLTATEDGVNKILEFLGDPPVSAASSFSEPNSALVVIGYPAKFWLTDDQGKNHASKDNMTAVINPKSGNYKVNLIPQSQNTLFIVAQFLPNGQILYKEYNLTNRLPKFKTLKFDLQDPKEDILF